MEYGSCEQITTNYVSTEYGALNTSVPTEYGAVNWYTFGVYRLWSCEQIVTSYVSTEYGAVNWYKLCIYRIWWM